MGLEVPTALHGIASALKDNNVPKVTAKHADIKPDLLGFTPVNDYALLQNTPIGRLRLSPALGLLFQTAPAVQSRF